MKRALADHPVTREAAPSVTGHQPELTFIIGHRGMDRLPHLLATLESIAGQRGASVECVVVEQDDEARIPAHLPAWVRHVHTPLPRPDMPYCRAWAFNCGARHADGAVLVLHDNDLLVPADYSMKILERVGQGFQVVNLKRFIFYLGEHHTRQIMSDREPISSRAPIAIMQNSEGGGSIAITRSAFDRIGGMDETFLGWGGEDNEFWERALTVRVWPYTSLPLVHLWHEAQPGKYQSDNATLSHYQNMSRIPAETRIEQLRGLASGANSGPIGWQDRNGSYVAESSAS